MSGHTYKAAWEEHKEQRSGGQFCAIMASYFRAGLQRAQGPACRCPVPDLAPFGTALTGC